jgi:hypothetical protein
LFDCARTRQVCPSGDYRQRKEQHESTRDPLTPVTHEQLQHLTHAHLPHSGHLEKKRNRVNLKQRHGGVPEYFKLKEEKLEKQ